MCYPDHVKLFKRHNRSHDLFLMLIAVVLANINPVFAKVIYSSGWTPVQMYFVVLIVIAVIMSLYQLVEMEHGEKWGMTKEDFGGTLFAAISGGSIAPVMFFEGLALVNASTAIILSSVLPLFVVIFAVIFLNERMNAQMLAGGVLLIVAIAVLQWQNFFSLQISKGVPLILGSSLLSALTIIVHKKHVKHRHMDSIILVRTVLSLLFVGGWLLVTQSGFSFLVEPLNIWPVLALPICSFIIPFFLYFRSLTNLTASDAGVMEAFGRIFGIAAAASVLGEVLTSQHILSMLIATFGIVLINVPLTKWRIAPSRLPFMGPMRK